MTAGKSSKTSSATRAAKGRTSPAKAKTGPGALVGTAPARRAAAVVLEVLSGVSGPQDGAERMGVALPRYYQLETRALQAIIDALEPRPRGRRLDLEQEIAKLEEEKTKLHQRVLRYQALHRAAQRALGLPAEGASSSAAKKGGSKAPKTVRRRRQKSRGERVVDALRSGEGFVVDADGEDAPSSTPSST